jgi:crotonobetainyl-CoA:carnitine CoA-transferase CaiB-like acyl-CoA transferase
MNAPLADMLIVEFGHRLAVRACSSLLAQAGATIIMVEPQASRSYPRDARSQIFAGGKLSICWDPSNAADRARVRALIEEADVVLLSTDVGNDMSADIDRACKARPVVCDITATGSTGPLAAQPLSDAAIQALCGILDTTGLADGPPIRIGIPVVELSTAIYAAVAIVAVWRTWRTHRISQRIDMALYDVAVNALTTFLPGHFGGGATKRLGNGHSMGVPWNAYPAVNGWVLLCSTSDADWRTICGLIGRPKLASDARFAELAGRVANRAHIDRLVSAWTRRHSVNDCLTTMSKAGLACGEIVPLATLLNEPNLIHRGRMIHPSEPHSRLDRTVIGPVIKLGHEGTLRLSRIPSPGEDDCEVQSLVAQRRASLSCRQTGQPRPTQFALANLRVVEIGHFTTAPLVARHLAMLGAQVIKVEPPEGEMARRWSPHRNGLSLFFVMSNSGKKSIAIDLRSSDGRSKLSELVADADVLVENMKPGSLARLGFSSNALREINPRLIYCAISGFGADSIYKGKRAFDTVVQAMSGIMDASRYDGLPLKSGISIADISGGQFGLLAILEALVRRDRTGEGQLIDISMQDAGAWLAQAADRLCDGTCPVATVLQCRDGYILAETLNGAPIPAGLVEHARNLTSHDAMQACRGSGVDCVPVQAISGVVDHPQTIARDLIVDRSSPDGTGWKLLRSPFRFSATPPRVGDPIGKLSEEDRGRPIGFERIVGSPAQ